MFVKQSLITHIDEFRARLIKSMLCILGCFFVLINFSESILSQLSMPIQFPLYFVGPHEAFVASLKVSFFSALLVASPFVIYQGWNFLAAGLHENEKRSLLIFMPLSLIFFITGAGFAFFIIVPISLQFLLGFCSKILTPMITITQYVSFLTTLVLSFGAVFQLPVVVIFLTKVGLINEHVLIQKRKIAILMIFILSAALTPPDVITQTMMAIPLILLYEISIFCSKLISKKQNKF